MGNFPTYPSLKVGPNTVENIYAGALCELAFDDENDLEPFYSMWDKYPSIIMPFYNWADVSIVGDCNGATTQYDFYLQSRASFSADIDNTMSTLNNFSLTTTFGSNDRLTFTFAPSDFSRTIYTTNSSDEEYLGIPQYESATWVPESGGTLTSSVLQMVYPTRPTKLHSQLLNTVTGESFFSSIPQNATVEDGCFLLLNNGGFVDPNLISNPTGSVDIGDIGDTSSSSNLAQRITLLVFGFLALVVGGVLLELDKKSSRLSKVSPIGLMVVGLSVVVTAFTIKSAKSSNNNALDDRQDGIWEDGVLLRD
jgi:hypothetical protein